MLATQGIAHAGLKADDLSALSAFYEHKVGLRLIEQHDGCHLFDIGGGALFEMWSGGTASAERKSAAQQSLRICFKVGRLETAMEELKSRGVMPVTEIGSYLGTRWIHYVDPEGNAFGLVDSNG